MIALVMEKWSEQPEASPRALTDQDVVRLADGKAVPGLDLNDPEERVLRAGLRTQLAKTMFASARSDWFLQSELGYGLYSNARVLEQLTRLWGIWCAKHGMPCSRDGPAHTRPGITYKHCSEAFKANMALTRNGDSTMAGKETFLIPNRWFDAGFAACTGPSVSALYFVLCRWTDWEADDWIVSRSIAQLCEQTGLSASTVRPALRDLETLNVITRLTPGENQVNRWRMNDLPESCEDLQLLLPEELIDRYSDTRDGDLDA